MKILFKDLEIGDRFTHNGRPYIKKSKLTAYDIHPKAVRPYNFISRKTIVKPILGGLANEQHN
tara:strand:+ start:268 stop:456 length:189 start_codon:yes stop_codon:yes gene_type:complete